MFGGDPGRMTVERFSWGRVVERYRAAGELMLRTSDCWSRLVASDTRQATHTVVGIAIRGDGDALSHAMFIRIGPII